MLLLSAAGLFVTGGCVSPVPQPPSDQIPLDADPLHAGITSGDVRTVATKMAPAILALPEISEGSGLPVRIKIADIKNSSRFFIDRNLFTKRLAVELNRYGRGQVRFLNNNEKAVQTRNAVLSDRQFSIVQNNIKKIAAEIAASPAFFGKKSVKVAVIPVLNTNLVNMNADSFAAMLRSELFNASGGRIQFLMPGVTEGADYYLTGQFIPETMKNEGIINLANYIDVVDARVKAGKSMYVTTNVAGGSASVVTTTRQGSAEITSVAPGSINMTVFEDHLKRILSDPAMRANSNVNKRFNVMVVDAKAKLSVYEKMILIDRKTTDNSGAARFILSGEISGMHQRKNGLATDYVMVSIQLIDVENNETVWEDAYEVKRMTANDIVYR